MSFLKTILAVLVIAAIGYLSVSGKLRFFDVAEYKSSVGEFVSLKGLDEYVISELLSNETFTDRKCTKTIKFGPIDQCVGIAKVTQSVAAHYKYYVKMGELKYYIDGDTLVFEAPELHLSKPVAYESSNQDYNCASTTFFGDCAKTLRDLDASISGDLESKGFALLPSVYEKAAKNLADNFYAFSKKNEAIYFKKIAVSFLKEGSSLRHLFSYNNSYYGKEACTSEIELGKRSLRRLGRRSSGFWVGEWAKSPSPLPGVAVVGVFVGGGWRRYWPWAGRF